MEENQMNEDVVQEGKEEVDYSKFETLLLNYFNGMKEMIAALNQKDRNLLDLGKELSDYRQGLESVMFKSLASYLIGFRESLVKQKENLIRDQFKNFGVYFDITVGAL